MNNLDLPEVASNQNQKEATINEQAFALDAAFSNVLAVDLSQASRSLTKVEFTRNVCFIVQGNDTARTITVYPAVKRQFTVINQGSADLTVASSSSTVTVPAGNASVLHTDGDAIWQASSGPVAPSGIADAPADGVPRVRLDAAWAKLVEGDNVSLDTTTTPGEVAISASGGGGVMLPDPTNNAGKVLAVNDQEDGVEWVPQSGGGGGASLPDMTGHAGDTLIVNATEDGVEWSSGINTFAAMSPVTGPSTTGQASKGTIFTPLFDFDLRALLVNIEERSGIEYEVTIWEMDDKVLDTKLETVGSWIGDSSDLILKRFSVALRFEAGKTYSIITSAISEADNYPTRMNASTSASSWSGFPTSYLQYCRIVQAVLLGGETVTTGKGNYTFHLIGALLL